MRKVTVVARAKSRRTERNMIEIHLTNGAGATDDARRNGSRYEYIEVADALMLIKDLADAVEYLTSKEKPS